MSLRVCAYCGTPIPNELRADARYCGPSHRAMASQRRLRAERKKKSSRRAPPDAEEGTAGEPWTSKKPVPLHAMLLPPAFLELDPWLWMELLIRMAAPPRAVTYMLSAYPPELIPPLDEEHYKINPFAAPKFKSPVTAEVHFFSDSGVPLSTVSRLVMDFGPWL